MQQFIGTWQLVQCLEIQPNGESFHPFGEDAKGYLIYQPNGVMSAQVSSLHEPNSANNNITQRYTAYFGHFDVDTENQQVLHHVEGALFIDRIGKTLPRAYTFLDDGHLLLKPLNTDVNRELTWRRI